MTKKADISTGGMSGVLESLMRLKLPKERPPPVAPGDCSGPYELPKAVRLPMGATARRSALVRSAVQ